MDACGVTPSESSSSESSPLHSRHDDDSSSPSPHLSIRSSIVGSSPADSSSSDGPPAPRFPFPTHFPMYPHLHPMKSCFPNAVPPGPTFLPRSRFISSLLASKPLPRRAPTRPRSSSQSPQPPEVSVEGFLSTPPLSVASTLSSLSPLSLTPPPSPSRNAALSCFRPRQIKSSKSEPLLSRLDLPSSSLSTSFSPSIKPLPTHKSLKKSVSELNLNN
ncbi:unnamed protein product [Leptosia nina]|uniref:Uncharacterized protein n=1 Tax=Leptosia nina TaxID=320188 RepID=A0AAV1JZN7_9NEOP